MPDVKDIVALALAVCVDNRISDPVGTPASKAPLSIKVVPPDITAKRYLLFLYTNVMSVKPYYDPFIPYILIVPVILPPPFKTLNLTALTALVVLQYPETKLSVLPGYSL